MVTFSKASKTIALCSIANFINSADRVIMPIASVPMAAEYNWGLHGQGWVLSSFAVGYMSSQVRLRYILNIPRNLNILHLVSSKSHDLS